MKVSAIVPSRGEPARQELFLNQTVSDLLSKARGDLEVIVVADGYWPNPPLPTDKRLKVLHRGKALGMRPAINTAVQIATGDYILKSDSHCLWDEGYDVKLIQAYHEDNWIVVPRRYALDPENWCIEKRPDNKYPIDYHKLVEPFHAYGDSNPGLHGTEWRERRDARTHIELDDELSSQGSGWFMSRKCWDWLGPQDVAHYGNFVHEFQEMGLKCWLGGGAVKVFKGTYYSHLYKGARYGRMYTLSDSNHGNGVQFCTWFWMTDQPFKARVHNLKWLIEKFAPVPTWPDDLDAIFARAHRECRNPYQVAA